MGIQDWSDSIILADLNDDPLFSDEVATIIERIEQQPKSVVLDMSDVDFLNSSNIAKILRLRKMMIGTGKQLTLCAVGQRVWGVLMVTGLDRILDFANDVSTGLATVQLPEQA